MWGFNYTYCIYHGKMQVCVYNHLSLGKKVLSRETYLELYQLNVILQDIINIL